MAVTANVSPRPEQLFMATNHPSGFASSSESLFYSSEGVLVFR